MSPSSALSFKRLLSRLPCSHKMSSTSLGLKGLRHTMSSELTKLGSVLKREKIRPTNLSSIALTSSKYKQNAERLLMEVNTFNFLCFEMGKEHTY